MNTKNSVINAKQIKKLYLDGCRRHSIKPKKRGLNNFMELLEKDASYWMKANLKYFFESLNY